MVSNSLKQGTGDVRRMNDVPLPPGRSDPPVPRPSNGEGRR
jgi:hypothetical protein